MHLLLRPRLLYGCAFSPPLEPLFVDPTSEIDTEYWRNHAVLNQHRLFVLAQATEDALNGAHLRKSVGILNEEDQCMNAPRTLAELREVETRIIRIALTRLAEQDKRSCVDRAYHRCHALYGTNISTLVVVVVRSLAKHSSPVKRLASKCQVSSFERQATAPLSCTFAQHFISTHCQQNDLPTIRRHFRNFCPHAHVFSVPECLRPPDSAEWRRPSVRLAPSRHHHRQLLLVLRFRTATLSAASRGISRSSSRRTRPASRSPGTSIAKRTLGLAPVIHPHLRGCLTCPSSISRRCCHHQLQSTALNQGSLDRARVSVPRSSSVASASTSVSRQTQPHLRQACSASSMEAP